MSEYSLSLEELQGYFEKYKRWVQEGRKPHFRDTRAWDKPSNQKQYFFDTYHEHLEEVGPEEYEFSIQTSDSYAGDTWVRGRFRANGLGTVVEILEQRAESS